ncbi:helix-turn-helix transcriptional regulator [Phototrophicus methaneseepsis]|uniref:Helix-turn-helix transcriptional regulator n=1 Tax=Phototrophicus methaneseepsis TaxID=2710758 RepID=A0A7S8E9G8_9CHLR|nr:helix-turn-helix transcriptional regulator [Phototrophicus methaneseepsis]QPC82837.1 helix-turn-helix transcriptional regulator [Phototrophicus methaneseepsis]
METTNYTSRGILYPQQAEQAFKLSRHAPAHDLAFFIDRYWVVQWDLRGQAPYQQENIPSPYVNLVFDPTETAVFGVSTKRFTYLLEGTCMVFSVKFRIGAFYPFIQSPVSDFTDGTLSLNVAFGQDAEATARHVLAENTIEGKIALVEPFLRQHLPAEDHSVTLVNEIMDSVAHNNNVRRVEQLSEHVNMSVRSLQRLFHQYVGISPKSVIQRYRLQDAAARIEAGDRPDWALLATEMGYFDQAHFINDFKRVIGRTPAEYASLIED